jgi:hypothetical protein
VIRFEKKTVAETAPKEEVKSRPDPVLEAKVESKEKAAPRSKRAKAAPTKDEDRLI